MARSQAGPIVAVVQARLGSTRLPGKALERVAGRPMLAHVLERAGAIPGVERVVLATTTLAEDDALAELARETGVASVRGSVDDVLDRFHQVLLAYPCAALARVTGDCPLLDPEVFGLVVAEYLRRPEELDYVGNVTPPSFPDGLDAELITSPALEQAWREARLPSDREHVTLYVRRNLDRFGWANVACPETLADRRWTVDAAADLEFVRSVYAALAPRGDRIFGMAEVLDLLGHRPELALVNGGIRRDEGLARSLARDAALERLPAAGGPEG